jgi:diacylglycerol O-acyltransferase
METMGALDSAFLQLEDVHAALHIGSVGVFDGPAPPYSVVRDAIAARLPRVPRYLQRMRVVPGQLGRPVWEEDPDFDINDHLRRSALPDPGGDRELEERVGRIMSEPLDHDRPLWESWLVEGLDGGRWALVTKVHHSMVDGIAGTDLLTTLFGREDGAAPAGEPAETVPPARPTGRAAPTGSVVPEASRGRIGLIGEAVRGNAHDSVGAVRASAAALGHPRSLAGTVRIAADGLLHFLTALRPVDRSSLIGPLGSDRLYRWAEVSLADALGIRAAFGCTVNDVVLAAVSTGFQDLLLERGERPSRHTVRTLVPVSVRRADQRGVLDNRVSAILVELPVDEADPVAALRVVARRMRRLKHSHEAEAGELITALGNVVPPLCLAAGLRLAFRAPQRILTTVTTNVPGPREELRLADRPMVAAYPYVPIADQLRTGIAVTSYGGRLLFGFTADRDSTPDVDRLRDGLLRGFEELSRRAEVEESR